MSEETTRWGGELWAVASLATPMAIRVAATLRLADHIAGGARTSGDLADAVAADPNALERVLRHLVAAGVLSQDGSGSYQLTSLGQHLRADDPVGVRDSLDLEGAIGYADLCFVELLHTVRTGEPAFLRRYGRTFWEDLSSDAERAASFDAQMGSGLAVDAIAVAAAYPWGDLGHVVDVGGGDGTLLIAILRAFEDLGGTVVDLAGPVSRAERAIAEAGLGHRADARVGSAFDPLPTGAGGYILSRVLHGWDDDAAARILHQCVVAAPEQGRVILIEDAIAPSQGGGPDSEGDLRMLCYVGGRGRTADQLSELAATVGLHTVSVRSAGSRSIIELRAAP